MYKAVLEGLQCRDLTSAAAQADTLDAYLLREDIKNMGNPCWPVKGTIFTQIAVVISVETTKSFTICKVNLQESTMDRK